MKIPCRISENKGYLVVAEDTQVQWTHRGITYRRTLPEGYEFRPGAGVETLLILSSLAVPYALHNAAALHDYLYEEIEDRPEDAVPRVVADAALKSDKSDPKWLRQVAWRIVRVVGVIPWLGGT